ncbi:MAG: Lrp/AsnC family transcriptional regulator [archaeon]
MAKLDLKDKKILYELDINSRQPYNAIAKKVGLSKDSVIYRIKNLQKAGIIRQFHTIIDVGKLGFISFRLYLKFQNTTPEIEQEIIDFFKQKKIVTWLASRDGGYNLAVWVLTKKVKEMNDLWKEMKKKYLNYIDKKRLTIFTNVSYYPRAYFLEKKENMEEYIFITEPEEVETDNTDIEILKLLAPDARIPVLEIAKKLNITAKTVTARIKELEKKKVIIGYRTLFDLDKLGYEYFKVDIDLQNITEEKLKQFRAFVKMHPNIIYNDEVLGGSDMEIEIQVKSLQDLRALINKIKEQFSSIIKEYDYYLVYDEHKYLFFPL